jgi:Cdc6-like AAA superfamily ATPase
MNSYTKGNNDVFDSNYLPEKCPHRDDIIIELKHIFTLNSKNMPGKLFLIGPAGSGKTLTARKICSILAEENENNNYSVYINCSIYRTEHMVLERIIHSVKSNYRCRGLSCQNLIKGLVTLLTEKNIHLTIILDDIHEFSDAKNLLGDLCEINDYGLSNASSYLSFISTSLNSDILLKLKPKSQRILERCAYELKPYSVDELYDILQETVKNCVPSDYIVSDSSLHFIADAAGAKNDAKYALELLKESILYQSNSDSVANPLENTKLKAHSEIRVEKIDSLSKHELLCLLGICEDTKDNNFTHTGSSYKNYIELCKEHGELMRTRCQFWRYINVLSKRQIISTSRTKGGNEYGNTTLIKLGDMDHNIIEKKAKSLIGKDTHNMFQ